MSVTPEASKSDIHAVAEDIVSDDLARVVDGHEREILTYIADDATNMAIANLLKISVSTVERHRENIMRKLNLHTASNWSSMPFAKG